MTALGFLAIIGGIYLLGVATTWYIGRWLLNDKTMMDIIAWFWPVTLLGLVVLSLWRNVLWPFLTRTTENLDWIVFRKRARLVHSDEFGELWQGPAPDEREHFKAIRVRDSIGTHWIRVPPDTLTARQGVHWTYPDSRIPLGEFNPVRY